MVLEYSELVVGFAIGTEEKHEKVVTLLYDNRLCMYSFSRDGSEILDAIKHFLRILIKKFM